MVTNFSKEARKGGRKKYITERNGRSSWERQGIVKFCTCQWNEWMENTIKACAAVLAQMTASSASSPSYTTAITPPSPHWQDYELQNKNNWHHHLDKVHSHPCNQHPQMILCKSGRKLKQKLAFATSQSVTEGPAWCIHQQILTHFTDHKQQLIIKVPSWCK